jgi:hypothetical protein
MRRIGTESAQTRALLRGIVGLVGGGLSPTLDRGGGARARVPNGGRLR